MMVHDTHEFEIPILEIFKKLHTQGTQRNDNSCTMM
jgi:hypothetical protein